ncbi:unnamed protein product, partial [Mesorhabditis belari]|uniref:PH domain-containing protein n=1 Tax=Mesorhabditis belari TaxID=2138241 RepID=A0AAF3J5I3_9BILA
MSRREVEVIKYGQLQKKLIRTKGTLRRKKVAYYEDSLWVALCVHDHKIPLIEWYRTEESLKEHNPIKVIDLLYTNYVTITVQDHNCFVIGFKGNQETLELAAITSRERSEWVTAVNDCLIRLGVLQNESNVYGDCVPQRSAEPLNLLDSPLASSQTTSPIRSPYFNYPNLSLDEPIPLSDEGISIENENRHSYGRLSNGETVPPMNSRRHSSVDHSPARVGTSNSNGSVEHSTPTPKPRKSITSNGSITPTVQIRPPLPPRQSDSNEFPNQNRFTTSSDEGIYDLPRSAAALSLYDSLSPLGSPVVNSALISAMSTTSLASSSTDSRASSELRHERQHDFRRASLIPPHPNMDYLDDPYSQYTSIRRSSEHIEARGMSQPLRSVSVSLTMLIESVLFVEIGNRVWVGGWTQNLDQQLSCLFRVGDELVEVENTPVHGIENIPQLFYDLSTPGSPITLQIRPIPNAITCRLVKPFHSGKDLGIVLHKEKNKISNIIEDSAAYRRGIPKTITSYFEPNLQTPTVITEVNHRRLNPLSKSSEPLQRINAVREGMEFSITLQPYDFMKEMKKQLRKVPHHKLYLGQ